MHSPNQLGLFTRGASGATVAEQGDRSRGNLSVAGLPLLDEDIEVIAHVRWILQHGSHFVWRVHCRPTPEKSCAHCQTGNAIDYRESDDPYSLFWQPVPPSSY